MPRFLSQDERNYLIKRKGWTEEMCRAYERSGKVEGDQVLKSMIEEVKPFETLESGVKFRDKRKRTDP